MKLTFDLEGIQEGRKYVFEFCLSENGKVVGSTTAKTTTVKKTEKKKTGSPSLEDFEEKENKPPKFEEPKIEHKPTEFKIESSFGTNKIEPGKSI